MQNTSRAIILGVIILPATSLQSNELGLVNVDSSQDTTVAQTDSHLIWLSDNFGELTIAFKRAASINGEPLLSKWTIPEVAAAVSLFTDSLRGELAVTGAYASGNEEREHWDIETTVEWRAGDYRHDARINYESHSLDGSAANYGKPRLARYRRNPALSGSVKSIVAGAQIVGPHGVGQ